MQGENFVAAAVQRAGTRIDRTPEPDGQRGTAPENSTVPVTRRLPVQPRPLANVPFEPLPMLPGTARIAEQQLRAGVPFEEDGEIGCISERETSLRLRY